MGAGTTAQPSARAVFQQALDAPLPAIAVTEGSAPENPYNAFIGRSRDDIITRYGAPTRSTKLDSGLTLMEYRTSTRYRMSGNEKTDRSVCILRLWHTVKAKGSKIVKAGQLGDFDACAAFVISGIRNSIQCKGLFCVYAIAPD